MVDFHEATWVHKYKGNYYLSYSDNHEDGVNIEVYGTGGYNVGWTAEGEWLEYTVNVTKSDYYAVQVYAASPEPLKIEIFDLQGRQVRTFNENSMVGINKIPINVRNITSGYYFVKLSRGNSARTEKLLVIR